MRLSTRRSISHAAVLGLLSTTPLIAGWAGADTVVAPVSAAAPTGSDHRVGTSAPVHLAASGTFGSTWLESAPVVDETLRATEAVDTTEAVDGAAAAAPPGLTAAELDAIDTSEVTVIWLGDERDADDAPTEQGVDFYTAADGVEVTAERIHTFLDARDAPMADQAEEILAAGIAHDVDPRLIVGIAIAESNGGERLPVGSHNAWGWGGSGKFGLAHWDSWEEALDYYAERLGALYDTDNVDEEFAQTYVPPNWRWWLDVVTWVIDEI